MHVLWIGITTSEVLCHGTQAYNTVQAMREGNRLVAGPGLFLGAVRDRKGTVIGFGILVNASPADVVPRDTAQLEPYRQAVRRVLTMHGIIGRDQGISVHIQDDVVPPVLPV